MPAPALKSAGAAMTPTELRQLSSDDRNAILESQAELAEHDYRTDHILTDFEAFDESSNDGAGASAPAG